MNLRRLFPFYLFLLALLIRLAVLAATYQGNEHVHYFEDVGIAINLLDGKGYVLDFTMVAEAVPLRPTAVKPPVYPFLVFLVFFAFGMKNFFALFAIHALLAALTCTVLYLSIAKFSHYKAVVASVAFALYPPFVYHSVTIPESTTLTLFLISVFCYGLLNLQGTVDQNRWILTSIVSGLLAMTEPVTVPFIFLAFLYVAYLNLKCWKEISLQMLTVTFVFAATIAPWSLRNYFTFNQFVFIKSSFGSSLIDSMYQSGMRLPKETHLSLVKEVRGMDEISEDKAVKKALIGWIVDNPGAYLRLLPRNFVSFWWEIDRYKNNRSTRYILGRKVPYILLLLLSVPAMLWTLTRIDTNKLRMNISIYQNIMLILILTYTAIYTVMGSWNLRYHFPVQLGMCIFCAETIRYLLDKVRAPSRLDITHSVRSG